MRARAGVIAAVAVVAARAHADPKPKPVDIKAYRDQLIVLQDAAGGTYVLVPGINGPAFYSTPGHPLYEQHVVNGFRDGDTWIASTHAPRSQDAHLAHIMHEADGAYRRWCSPDKSDVVGLTEITGDRAKQIIVKGSFVTSGLIRVPKAFARDDTGVYYYVDQLNKIYGGKGYRLFIGRKGAMKEAGLSDIASDDAGEIYSTKLGVLKVAHNPDNSAEIHAWWIRGEKKMELTALDEYSNYSVIYRDLGIYAFTGTLCDDM
jgi:hypothetical protein